VSRAVYRGIPLSCSLERQWTAGRGETRAQPVAPTLVDSCSIDISCCPVHHRKKSSASQESSASSWTIALCGKEVEWAARDRTAPRAGIASLCCCCCCSFITVPAPLQAAHCADTAKVTKFGKKNRCCNTDHCFRSAYLPSYGLTPDRHVARSLSALREVSIRT
jgi:hypothetical protein